MSLSSSLCVPTAANPLQLHFSGDVELQQHFSLYDLSPLSRKPHSSSGFDSDNEIRASNKTMEPGRDSRRGSLSNSSGNDSVCPSSGVSMDDDVQAEEAEEEAKHVSPISWCSAQPFSLHANGGRRNAVCALALSSDEIHREVRIIQKSVEDRNNLREMLAHSSLFSFLEPEALDTAVDAMEVEEHVKGDCIFKQGEEPVPKLYVLIRGRCGVIKNNAFSGEEEPGAIFGELELMYQQKAASRTVQCMTPEATFYTLDRDLYQRILLKRCLEQRTLFTQYVEKVPFLKYVSEYDRLRVADALTESRFTSGEALISFGQQCNDLFFLMEGKARVLGRTTTGAPVEVTVLESGAVVGELEYVFKHNAVADVVAITSEVKAGKLSREHFEAIMGPGHQLPFLQFIADEPGYEEYLSRYSNRSIREEMRRLREGGGQETITTVVNEESSTGVKRFVARLSHDGDIIVRLPEYYFTPLGSNSRADSESRSLRTSPLPAVLTSASSSCARFHLHDVVAFTGALLFCVREDGVILSWSKQLEAATGYHSGEVIGQTVFALLQSDSDQARFQQSIQRAVLIVSDAMEESNQELFSTIKSQTPSLYRFSRKDLLTTAILELDFISPDGFLDGSGVEDVSGLPKILLAVGKEKPAVSPQPDAMVSGKEIMQQIRHALAKPIPYEQRIFLIADVIESYETIQRAAEVPKEDWQIVQLRQLVGKIITESANDCIDNSHTIHQRFANLTSEEACVDIQRLPRVLRHTLGLITRYVRNAEVTLTVSMKEHGGMEFLAFIFSCDNDHISPALSQLIQEIHIASQLSPTGGVDNNSLTRASVEAGRLSKDDIPAPPLSASLIYGDVDGDPSLGSGHTSLHFATDSAAGDIQLPKFKKHLRGIRHAVEQQGGTIRTHKDDTQSHVMYLLPFISPTGHFASTCPVSTSPLNGHRSPIPDSNNHSREYMEVSSLLPAQKPTPMPVPRSPALAPASAGSQPSALWLPRTKSASSCNTGPSGSLADTADSNMRAAVTASLQMPTPASPTISFTTLVAEENTMQRNLLCQYLWKRRHTVLTATSFSEVKRYVESADILIVDVMQCLMQTNTGALEYLHERCSQLAVVVTGDMDQATHEAYVTTGFLTLPKPVGPADFTAVLDSAERRVTAYKKDAMAIATIRQALWEYRLTSWVREELLGKGAHGEVFRATSTTGDVMAVKEMRVGSNNEKLEEVLSEISTMCSLQHRHIIHYFSCELSPTSLPEQPSALGLPASSPVEKSDVQYLRVFMEFASGGSLKDYMSTLNGKLEFKDYRRLLHEVVSGLAYIHAHHYLHGDIKTANVLLTENMVAKIGDFGTARRVMPGELLYVMEGSLSYMSPECMSAGEIGEDGRKVGYGFPTDVWSLGIVAMEVVTNTAPYSHVKDARGPAALTQYLTTLTTETPDLSPLFDYPPCVTEFIAACLQVDPALRATAEELLHFSIFHETTDQEEREALKILRRTELRHALARYVAFDEPKMSGEGNGVAGQGKLPILGYSSLPTKGDDMDDFFDSDTTEEDEDEEGMASGVNMDQSTLNSSPILTTASIPNTSTLQGFSFGRNTSSFTPQDFDVHSSRNTPVPEGSSQPSSSMSQGKSHHLLVPGSSPASPAAEVKTRRLSINHQQSFDTQPRSSDGLNSRRCSFLSTTAGGGAKDSSGGMLNGTRLSSIIHSVGNTIEEAADDFISVFTRRKQPYLDGQRTSGGNSGADISRRRNSLTSTTRKHFTSYGSSFEGRELSPRATVPQPGAGSLLRQSDDGGLLSHSYNDFIASEAYVNSLCDSLGEGGKRTVPTSKASASGGSMPCSPMLLEAEVSSPALHHGMSLFRVHHKRLMKSKNSAEVYVAQATPDFERSTESYHQL